MSKKPQQESVWDCLICDKPIMEDDGISLDGSTEFHLCGTCYQSLPPEVRVAECRAWREASGRLRCLDSFSDLCRAAMASNAMYTLGRRPEPN